MGYNKFVANEGLNEDHELSLDERERFERTKVMQDEIDAMKTLNEELSENIFNKVLETKELNEKLGKALEQVECEKRKNEILLLEQEEISEKTEFMQNQIDEMKELNREFTEEIYNKFVANEGLKEEVSMLEAKNVKALEINEHEKQNYLSLFFKEYEISERAKCMQNQIDEIEKKNK